MQTPSHEMGSLKTLWKISFSLMISYLSYFCMMFVDRVYLSNYSPKALASVTSSATLCWTTSLGWITLTGMAQVFVAQLNGNRQFDKLASPVWQMLWLSLLSVFYFAPMAYFGNNGLLSLGWIDKEGWNYYYWITLFGPLPVALTALNAFYIGRGKAYIVQWLALLGNGINFVLDYVFIFGIKGVLPALGLTGAAIATNIGLLIQIAIIALLFFSKENRTLFGTMRAKIDTGLMWKLIKIAAPTALFMTFEMLAWSIFYILMHKTSPSHGLIAGVCQSVLILFLFFQLGLEKGSAVIMGHLIGEGKVDKLKKVFLNGVKLISIFSIILAFFFLFFPDILLGLFFHSPALTQQYADWSDQSVQMLMPTLKLALILTYFYMLTEALRWLISGILTGIGDTFFLMIAGTASIWLLMVLPTALFVYKLEGNVTNAYIIWIVYSILSVLIYAYRLSSKKWKERSVLSDQKDSIPT